MRGDWGKELVSIFGQNNIGAIADVYDAVSTKGNNILITGGVVSPVNRTGSPQDEVQSRQQPHHHQQQQPQQHVLCCQRFGGGIF